MASNAYESLLSPPNKKPRFSFLSCKTFLLTSLSIATLISVTYFLTLQNVPNTTRTTTPLLLPSDLCTNSPNPSSCHAIVSDILSLSDPKPTPLHVFNSLVVMSLRQLKSAELQVNWSTVKGPLLDCAQLMDMSRDRLTASVTAVATGAHTDARTWLSAVLTNHATCLDGLTGEPELEWQLKDLMGQASASLAVLNSIVSVSSSSSSSTPQHHDDYLSTQHVADLPSWMPSRDRKLLEVSAAPASNVVVALDGSGKFKKVQDAVDSAPNKGGSRYVIYVKKGVYKENVVIPKAKTNIMIVGDGATATILTGSLNVVDGSTTFNSATLAANADGLILQDMGIQNTAGAVKHQAVALRVSGDRAVINRCQIDAYQDTLYAHTLRQFYRDSTVSGTVDFIFGDAAVVFQNCNLVARRPMPNQQNLVTAQGRLDPNQNTGTSIQNCKVIPAGDLVPVKGSIPTYLGRPWKQYSRTVFMQSFLDSHIDPEGWAKWDGDFALNTLFYGEYQNKGPGAGTSGRVKWKGYRVITDANTAKAFTVAALIQGGTWLKSTGVAFTEGL